MNYTQLWRPCDKFTEFLKKKKQMRLIRCFQAHGIAVMVIQLTILNDDKFRLEQNKLNSGTAKQESIAVVGVQPITRMPKHVFQTG